ncbi:YbgA family protein [Alkalihalobacillus sp. CinArs1]|uniref:YbgA family protein n=1 Tax=Alkalihalobacillus sp. CinArs1 TaxID=2995314 RepID=UPI0022DD8C16|nr:YbgA family protein [Alkalihalobacillus sp. CinArs1]
MRKVTEKLWARNKYSVMAKGYEHYKRIGAAFKEAHSIDDLFNVYTLIGEAEQLPHTKKGMRTTLEHMWGYFKKRADEEEKQAFFRTMNTVLESEQNLSKENIAQLKTLVENLLEKYPSDYLSQSHFIKVDSGWNVVFHEDNIEGITKEDYKKASENKL